MEKDENHFYLERKTTVNLYYRNGSWFYVEGMLLKQFCLTFQLAPCRNTQASFDNCMKENYDMDRPHYGYHCLAKIHDTAR